MRKIFYFLFTISVSLNTYSQMNGTKDKSFKVSEPYKVFDAKTKLYFAKGKEAMAIKFDGDNIVIQKFEIEKPSFIKEKKYEKFFPKNYAVEEITELFKGKFAPLEKYYTKTTNKVYSNGDIIISDTKPEVECEIKHCFTIHSTQGETIKKNKCEINFFKKHKKFI